MKIECSVEGMLIIPEDYKDDLYLKNVIAIDKGKVFCRVVELDEKTSTKIAIEIVKFDEKISKPKNINEHNRY